MAQKQGGITLELKHCFENVGSTNG